MLNGTTYMVRPFIEPRYSSSSLPRISAGSFQLLVGPASASSAEQMKVRSSTRATSLGSEWAQYEPGRLSGSSSVNVPASTSCLQRSACSSSDPSNQWTSSGPQSSTISSTHASSRALRVGACTSATLRLQEKMGADNCTGALRATPNRMALRPGAQTWAGGRPRSISEPSRTLVARPSASRSKLTRCPWRSVWKSEPSSASAANARSARSASFTTMPSPEIGSYMRTTPCTTADPALGLLHLACLEAGGAHVETLRGAVHDRPDLLHVGVPTTLGPPVRVADAHAELRLLAAHLADRRHDGNPCS